MTRIAATPFTGSAGRRSGKGRFLTLAVTVISYGCLLLVLLLSARLVG